MREICEVVFVLSSMLQQIVLSDGVCHSVTWTRSYLVIHYCLHSGESALVQAAGSQTSSGARAPLLLSLSQITTACTHVAAATSPCDKQNACCRADVRPCSHHEGCCPGGPSGVSWADRCRGCTFTTQLTTSFGGYIIGYQLSLCEKKGKERVLGCKSVDRTQYMLPRRQVPEPSGGTSLLARCAGTFRAARASVRRPALLPQGCRFVHITYMKPFIRPPPLPDLVPSPHCTDLPSAIRKCSVSR